MGNICCKRSSDTSKLDYNVVKPTKKSKETETQDASIQTDHKLLMNYFIELQLKNNKNFTEEASLNQLKEEITSKDFQKKKLKSIKIHKGDGDQKIISNQLDNSASIIIEPKFISPTQQKCLQESYSKSDSDQSHTENSDSDSFSDSPFGPIILKNQNKSILKDRKKNSKKSSQFENFQSQGDNQMKQISLFRESQNDRLESLAQNYTKSRKGENNTEANFSERSNYNRSRNTHISKEIIVQRKLSKRMSKTPEPIFKSHNYFKQKASDISILDSSIHKIQAVYRRDSAFSAKLMSQIGIKPNSVDLVRRNSKFSSNNSGNGSPMAKNRTESKFKTIFLKKIDEYKQNVISVNEELQEKNTPIKQDSPKHKNKISSPDMSVKESNQMQRQNQENVKDEKNNIGINLLRSQLLEEEKALRNLQPVNYREQRVSLDLNNKNMAQGSYQPSMNRQLSDYKKTLILQESPNISFKRQMENKKITVKDPINPSEIQKPIVTSYQDKRDQALKKSSLVKYNKQRKVIHNTYIRQSTDINGSDKNMQHASSPIYPEQAKKDGIRIPIRQMKTLKEFKREEGLFNVFNFRSSDYSETSSLSDSLKSSKSKDQGELPKKISK